MRIAVVNFSRRRIGGTEQNLNVVIPEIESRGHRVQFLYFHDAPTVRSAIRTGPATALIDIAQTGPALALDRLRRFQPDVINVHGEIDVGFQSELLHIAPSAYSVHNYYGTCISGLKTHQLPVIQPCHARFGPACLINYFPRQCGGHNPVTMFRRYAMERRRLQVMSQYDAIITHSSHMEAEYLRHGLHPTRVHGLPYEVSLHHSASCQPRMPMAPGEPARLLYVGRMEKLKGGQILLHALPNVHSGLRREVELHLAGDGPERATWERMAKRIMAAHAGIRIIFHGWQTGEGLHRMFLESNLLAVPSLWPEPFGKVGPEAGGYGLPVAAFAVGGIGEWLLPGENGMAAPGDPPTAFGLSRAITDCLADDRVYRRLSEGALAGLNRFDLHAHVDRLLEVFEKIRRERPLARAAGQAL